MPSWSGSPSSGCRSSASPCSGRQKPAAPGAMTWPRRASPSPTTVMAETRDSFGGSSDLTVVSAGQHVAQELIGDPGGLDVTAGSFAGIWEGLVLGFTSAGLVDAERGDRCGFTVKDRRRWPQRLHGRCWEPTRSESVTRDPHQLGRARYPGAVRLQTTGVMALQRGDAAGERDLHPGPAARPGVVSRAWTARGAPRAAGPGGRGRIGRAPAGPRR